MKYIKVTLIYLLLISQFKTFGAANFGYSQSFVNRSKPVMVDNEIINEIEKKTAMQEISTDSENIRKFELINDLERKQKIEDDKEKNEFARLYSKFPDEIDYLIKNLQIAGLSQDVGKLISKYCESSNYELYQTIVVEDYPPFETTFVPFKTHDSIKLIELNNGTLAYSYGNIIKMWIRNYYNNWECIKTLKGIHEWTILSLMQLRNGDLITSSEDNIVAFRSRNLDTTWRSKFLRSKDNGYKFIELSNGDLASCSTHIINIWHENHDGTWDIYPFEGHDGRINSIIELSNGNLATCGDDKTVKIWQQKSDKSWEVIQTLKGHMSFVSSIIQLNNKDIISCSSDSIKIWRQDVDKSWKCIQTLINWDEKLIASIIQLSDGNLATCSFDQNIRIWRQKSDDTLECIQVLKGHTKSIDSIIELQNGDLVSASSKDRSIKIWRKPFIYKIEKTSNNIETPKQIYRGFIPLFMRFLKG